MDDLMAGDLADVLHAVQEALAGLVPAEFLAEVDGDTVTLPPVDQDGSALTAEATELPEPGVVDPTLMALSAGTDNHVVGSLVLPSPFSAGSWA